MATDTFVYTGATQHVTVPAGAETMTVTARGGQGGLGVGAAQVLTHLNSLQHFTVPVDVDEITIECRGQAANFGSHYGGYGGVVIATFPATPGTVYDVWVGGGTATGGVNGFPNGGIDPTTFGLPESGGGASLVTPGGGHMVDALIVAGGGGMGFGQAFGGHAGYGGDGGYPNGHPGRVNSDGDSGGVSAGQGGTQTAGGAGGLISGSTYEAAGDSAVSSNGVGYWDASYGTQGVGGNGYGSFSGPGGGGWHGGGAGQGGGGGSGHVRSDGYNISSVDGGHTSVNGTVTFRWANRTAGGLGGEVTATFSVTPGVVYDVYVADSGRDATHTGWPLGGQQTGTDRKGGGGGVSFITPSGAGLPGALIAAGGGGGGSDLTAVGGGGGYSTGIVGGSNGALPGGGGGTPSSGGVGPATTYGNGDTAPYTLDGVVVTRGSGGLGSSTDNNGAGGAGWHGGGAGTNPGTGGGGGSGHVTGTAITYLDASNLGQGFVSVSWVSRIVSSGWYMGMIPIVGGVGGVGGVGELRDPGSDLPPEVAPTPTPYPPPVVVPGSPPSGATMPTAAPAGYTRAWANDFNTNVPEGGFLSVYDLPYNAGNAAAGNGSVGAYPTSYNDTRWKHTVNGVKLSNARIITGTTTSGSVTVTIPAGSLTAYDKGRTLMGSAQIADRTRIVSFTSTTMTMSAAALASGAGVSIKMVADYGYQKPGNISVVDGVMRCRIGYNALTGQFESCVPVVRLSGTGWGYAQGGHYAFRARFPLVPTHKIAALTWPLSNKSTTGATAGQTDATGAYIGGDGEIDFPEMDFDGADQPGYFVHYQNGTGPGQQWSGTYSGSNPVGDGQWHTYEFWWHPGSYTGGTNGTWVNQLFRAKIDGVQVGIDLTTRIPLTPMRFTLQMETFMRYGTDADPWHCDPNANGSCEYDWIVYDAIAASVSTSRDPLLWPYSPTSFWNMPIGASATLVPLGFNYLGDTASQNSRVTVAEENILCLDPDAPQAYIKETSAAWDPALTRCGSRTGRNLIGNGTVIPRTLPIPVGMSTDPYIGTTPNMSGALVYRSGSDIQLFETQPLHVCSDNVAVSQYVNSQWVGDSLFTGGDGAKGGSHGGSYMTAFGGTIRLGELVPGGIIRHAIKLTMDTAYYCSAAGSAGHVWPALRADNGWASAYGTSNPSVPSAAKMGMLLTLPSSFDVEALSSEAARIMGRAIKNYGVYLVDGDANASVSHICQWQVERSNHGSFTTEFASAWGYQFFHQPAVHGTPSAAQLAFRAQVGQIMEAICIVTDNGPASIGGAGTRRTTMAPAF